MRCSVSGVSLLMFIFVTLGDSTYLIGVLLHSVDKVFIIRTLPWIMGSGWSVIFDVFVSSYEFIHKISDNESVTDSDTASLYSTLSVCIKIDIPYSLLIKLTWHISSYYATSSCFLIGISTCCISYNNYLMHGTADTSGN